MLRRVARALFEVLITRIRRRPALFAVLGAIVVFSSVLIKDNVAEAVQSNIQAVESAKEFYELHIEDIELNTRLNEVGDSVEELRHLVSKENIPNTLQETLNTAIQNHNDAVKNVKLIQASNADTEERVKHISDSDIFFIYSDAKERIVRNDLKIYNHALEDLRSDITTVKNELNEANRLVSVPNHRFTSEELAKIGKAYKKFSHDAEAAAIQSESLEEESRGTQAQAVKVAELYGQFLEDGDRVCKWAIIILVVTGSVLGLLSQLAGVGEGAVKKP